MGIREYYRNIIVELAREEFGKDAVPDPGKIKIDNAPANQFGTFGTNVPFLAAKKAGAPPMQTAERLARRFSESGGFKEVEAVKPGYVNWKVSSAEYMDEIRKIMENDDYFFNDSGKGERINLEFVSANPVGPLNIVSGRAAAFGDTLASLLEISGYDVTKEFYVNDAGRQMDLFGVSLKERYMELYGKTPRIPEDGYKGAYVAELARRIKEEKGDQPYRLYENGDFDIKNNFFREYGLEKMVQRQKETMKSFGVEYDKWFFESALYEQNEAEKAIEKVRESGKLYEQDGALWFRTTEYGDDKDRVVKKNNGEFTYFAGDMGYMEDKLGKRKYDRAVNIMGPDHHGYIKRMEAVCQALGYGREKLDILILQQVNLLQGGEKVVMSKRKGNIVTLEELIRETGKDAARYFFIMRNYNTHLDFDIDLAKEQSDKNPVYYIQYAYARICSIFLHAEEKGFRAPDKAPDGAVLEKAEEDLVLGMLSISDVIKEAAGKYSPSVLAAAVYDIVSSFHTFYNKCRVVSGDEKETEKRLYILNALRKTLGICFDIIGIEKREKM
ncbi:MAG: arginine--tRNA ligase [Candidatus Goldiibacteriota bacterium]